MENVILALDLGCGQNKITPEYFIQQMNIGVTKVIGVDYVQCKNEKGEDTVDVVHDLTVFPLPFENDSVDVIYSSHFLEHLDGFERAKFMDEVYRILKPEGKARFMHPYSKSVRASQDFTHKWPPINENSYYYWWKQWRVANKLTHGHYDLKCDFDFEIFYTWHDMIWEKKNEHYRAYAMNHYHNVIADMIVTLTKKVGR